MKITKLRIVLSALTLVFVFSDLAVASPSFNTWSGEYLGTLSKNELAAINGNPGFSPTKETAGLQSILDIKKIEDDIEFYKKFEFNCFNPAFGSRPFDQKISYYGIKAGADGNAGIAYYHLAAPSSYIDWSTIHVGGIGISHLSTWTVVDYEPPSNVPEPATLLLFGIGLLGLSGSVRRKK